MFSSLTRTTRQSATEAARQSHLQYVAAPGVQEMKISAASRSDDTVKAEGKVSIALSVRQLLRPLQPAAAAPELCHIDQSGCKAFMRFRPLS